jgi:excisionase family DNA binding protein
MNNQKTMTVKEVADYLKIHTSTVYRLVDQRKLPAFKVGSGWRFELVMIEQWRFELESGRTAI